MVCFIPLTAVKQRPLLTFAPRGHPLTLGFTFRAFCTSFRLLLQRRCPLQAGPAGRCCAPASVFTAPSLFVFHANAPQKRRVSSGSRSTRPPSEAPQLALSVR